MGVTNLKTLLAALADYVNSHEVVPGAMVSVNKDQSTVSSVPKLAKTSRTSSPDWSLSIDDLRKLR